MNVDNGRFCCRCMDKIRKISLRQNPVAPIRDGAKKDSDESEEVC
jgi:hypothetical protein